jgi:hypothetical protein
MSTYRRTYNERQMYSRTYRRNHWPVLMFQFR